MNGQISVAGLVDNQVIAIYPRGSELKKNVSHIICMKARLNRVSQCLFSLRFHRIITARQTSGEFSLQLKWRLNVRLIELFHSRGQQLCKFVWTKDSFYLTKKDQLPKDWFEAPKWPLFHGLGTTIWRDVVRKRFIIVDVKTEF